MSTAAITKRYRKAQNINQGEFGAAIAMKLRGIDAYSKQNVSLWENGVQQPAYMLVVLVFMTYRDWRGDWALEILRELKPKIWDLGISRNGGNGGR